ncbi:uncharacterized protein LOC119730120 [Patiria miniata]|uniref:Uncharacterized protein n=1 Tax=Patiria miniata TaxID=46514 RepID=A0A914A5P4_PATMI|nr:uncharacterized protein LOC119730120 [Patiria miniata]
MYNAYLRHLNVLDVLCLIYVVCFSLLVVAVGEAFQCFVCSSVTGTGCGDPFDASAQSRYRVACPATSICLKVTSGSTVARTCGIGNACAKSYECQGDNCAYCCAGDSCNSAGTVGFNLVLAAAMLVLTRMFY